MLITLRSEVLSVSANEGLVLIDAPGLAVTLDIEAASALSDQLLAGCTLAGQQQRAAIGEAPHSGHPRLDRTRRYRTPVAAPAAPGGEAGASERREPGRAG